MKIRIAKPSDVAWVDMTATFVTKETLRADRRAETPGFYG